MEFDNKINNCLLNYCYKDITNNRNFMLSCRQKCNIGLQKADQFVER